MLEGSRECRCEHIHRRTSVRRLAGECCSGGKKQVVRDHRRRGARIWGPLAVRGMVIRSACLLGSPDVITHTQLYSYSFIVCQYSPPQTKIKT